MPAGERVHAIAVFWHNLNQGLAKTLAPNRTLEIRGWAFRQAIELFWTVPTGNG